MANKTITQLDAAQSLNDNMVIAVQDTNATYKTTLADVKAYCSSGGGDAYAVGDRVTDDSNNPVGTVSSIFTDGNGQRYAVVCLDAVNRLASGQYLSTVVNVSDIPQYQNQTIWAAPETATTNTTAILSTASSVGYTSTACTHCRSKTFTIGGVTYAGQLPNLNELTQIFAKRTLINAQDPSASTYSSLVIPTSSATWSSTQCDVSIAWYVNPFGSATFDGKDLDYFVIPVLEIPLD